MADIETDLKCKFHEYFFGDDNNSLSKLQYLVHEFFQAENAVQKSEEKDELNEWIDSVINNLSPSIKRYTNKQINNLMTLIINEQSNRENAYNDLKLKFIETKKKGDIVYV
jgi:hypothetical protein